MHILVLASLSAIPLAGTPTTLASNPLVSASLTGLLPPSTVSTAPLGLRFAIHNGSRSPLILNLCSGGLKVERLTAAGQDMRSVATAVSFAMRLPSGYRMQGCGSLTLAPGATGDVDLFYNDRSFGAPGSNGNRLTLATDAGDFTFLSSTLIPGGAAQVPPRYYPDYRNGPAS